MSDPELRRQIAWEAGRLLYSQQESEYYRAKVRAAQRICRDWIATDQLPSDGEIRDQLQGIAHLHESDASRQHRREAHLAVLGLMRRLARFCPRLPAAALGPFPAAELPIDLYLHDAQLDAVLATLEDAGLAWHLEPQRHALLGTGESCPVVHVPQPLAIRLLVRAASPHEPPCDVQTGQPLPVVSIAQLERALQRDYPELQTLDAPPEVEHRLDRFQMYHMLLVPLEDVKLSPRRHPEGDALYHSLQVFDLARQELPYDEEFLLAALLHDVGKAIDPEDHIQAGLDALQGYITPRTAWLIANHALGHALHDGTLGARARRRLEASDNIQELLLLCRCDRAGRVAGVQVPDVDEALDYLRDLARTCGEG